MPVKLFRRPSRGHSGTPSPAAAVPGVPNVAPRRETALILAAFAVVFAGLAWYTIRQTSATWDEPMHLAAGHAALTSGDFRVDPSHPPLLRLWAALPTLVLPHRPMPPIPEAEAASATWLQDAYLVAHRFLYVDNDADRLLGGARLMTVALGVVLGAWLFLWARSWLGLGPALFALAAYTFEPNMQAHASLVTTDFGVTCLVFGCAFFTWRLSHGMTRGNVAGLVACTALAVVSKFSAILLAPVIVLQLAVAVRRRQIGGRDALAIVAACAIVSYAAIWAAYGFRHAPAPGAGAWRKP